MKATRRKKEWFDNESLWRETYFFLFPESLFVSAIETVDKALALLEPQGKVCVGSRLWTRPVLHCPGKARVHGYGG